MNPLGAWSRRVAAWAAIASVLLLAAHPVVHAVDGHGCEPGHHAHSTDASDLAWSEAPAAKAHCPVCVLHSAGVCLAAAPHASPAIEVTRRCASVSDLPCPRAELETPRSRGPPLHLD
jgi:hypothetical protein